MLLLMLLYVVVGFLFVLVIVTQLIYPIWNNRLIFPIFNKKQNKIKKLIRQVDSVKDDQELIDILEAKIKEIKNG